ncbi:PA2817 family protein [uncultured Gilvimarinus sp.]|uniref:PA2817 family protein n=1 Tax=uncultured Gilvimarinus sp. TaxID=1689143 RepID=UPI0030ED3D27|tara:strand:- start:492 stop:896 length:405 start_codon:yes stop_codon:yes gene_type:complete
MSQTGAEAQYLAYMRKLVTQFTQSVQQQPPFIEDDCDEQHLAFLRRLEALPQQQGDEYAEEGQALMCQSIAAYPHLTPLLPRDLLWHFGGDCLHFMPDEEIDRFQQLDEQRHEAEQAGQDFDYERERARVLGLH